jgi:nucleotide-binding universal stress UspA family protein
MTVLAAIDATAGARQILVTALAVARLLDTKVVAVHVRENGLDAVRRAAAEAAVELAIAEPPVVAALRSYGAAEDVELVVMGVRGSRGGPFPAGHIALDLATRLHKPVVVVPPLGEVSSRIDRILVPLDGTESAADAMRATFDIARQREADVIVLHVHTPEALPAVEDQPHHEVEAWSREFIARSPAYEDERTRLELRVGTPGAAIVEAAAQFDVDLVALAWSQRLDAGRAAVVREMLAASHVPTLLIPVGSEQP